MRIRPLTAKDLLKEVERHIDPLMKDFKTATQRSQEEARVLDGEIIGPNEPGGPRARIKLTDITHDCATFEVEEGGTLTVETLREAHRKVMEALYGRR